MTGIASAVVFSTSVDAALSNVTEIASVRSVHSVWPASDSRLDIPSNGSLTRILLGSGSNTVKVGA